MSNWAVAECAYCSCCVCLWRHNGSSLFPSTDLCPGVLCYSVQPIVLTPGEQLTWRDQAPQQRFGRARGGAVGVDWRNNWLVKGWNSSPFTQKFVFLLVRPVEYLNFTVQNVILVPKHNQNLNTVSQHKSSTQSLFFYSGHWVWVKLTRNHQSHSKISLLASFIKNYWLKVTTLWSNLIAATFISYC